MPHPFATSSLFRAWLYGEICAVAILGLFWLADLPFDPKFVALWLGIGWAPIAIEVYDRSAPSRAAKQPKIHMGSVAWYFDQPAAHDLQSFVEAVNAQQYETSEWAPDKRLPMRGPIEIQYDTYDDGDQTMRILPTRNDDGWTQAELLYEIHRKLNGGSTLGNHVFFEGLVEAGPGKFELLLGS